MSNSELQVRTENGKVVGRVLLRDGQIQISEDSGEDFRKAMEYILNKKSTISYWNGKEVVYAKLPRGPLDTLELLRDYLSHNYKFTVSLEKAVLLGPQLTFFSQIESSSIPLPIRRLKYFRSISPYSAIRRFFQESQHNGIGTTIHITDSRNSDSEVHLARDAATNTPALAA